MMTRNEVEVKLHAVTNAIVHELIALTPESMTEIKFEIVATDVGTRRDIPSWCERSGHTLLSMTGQDKVLRYFVRKA